MRGALIAVAAAFLMLVAGPAGHAHHHSGGDRD